MKPSRKLALDDAMNSKRKVSVLLYSGAALFFVIAVVLSVRGLVDGMEGTDQTGESDNHPGSGLNGSRPKIVRNERDALQTKNSNRVAEVELTVDQLVAVYNSRGAPAALESAKASTGKDRDSNVLFVLSYIAKVEPEWVAENLKGSGLSVTHQGMVVSAVMESWKDGFGALVWASAEFTGDLRKTAIGQALKILIQSDPQIAVTYLESMPPGASRSQASADIFSAWGGHDPRAAISYATELQSSDERASALSYVVSAWARANPREAVGWLESVQESELKTTLIREAADGWYSTAPEDAVSWVSKIAEVPFRESILDQFAEIERNTIRCGEFDPSQPANDEWKRKSVSEMTDVDLYDWASQETEKFLSFVENAPADTDLKPLALPAVVAMAENDGIATAFKFAKAFPGKARPEAMRVATIMWAGEDPSSAAAQLLPMEPGVRQPLSTALVDRWSRDDPAAAASWVGSLELSEQTPLIVPIFQIWSDQDPRRAYKWIESLPAGEARDAGLNQVLNRERDSDPESLDPWVELFSTPELRAKHARKLK